MSHVDPSMDRRAVLAAGAGLAAAAAVPGAATAQSDELESWLSEANNYDEIQDMTGQDEVTVDVGAGNGLAFGPAAIRVDPGTTVVWEWTGSGGPHNVSEVDGAFRSGDATPEAGTTFEHTFEEVGEFRYVCEPHQGAGMKGAVVVGGGAGPDPAALVEEFLADANNYDGVTDLRGQDQATVDVGAGNGLAFGPAAIHVDPGTTVVWEWTGSGGPHNVSEVDDAFRSGDATPEAGTTFEHTFEEAGVARYVCEPHQGAGMKGAVVVGGGGAGGAGGGGSGDGNGTIGSSTFAAVTGVFLVPILFALALLGKELASDDESDEAVGHSHP
ncbi:halocyanin domain-containing protein [Salinarchaeum laminariae]|uniref:halocyanin domain-containing protein n=1 Tax=Salinarchaeum laminariae TaxID=869888 RepID=UPI0020C1637A|nr:halocyanin domain-containing protein [Salinarchaeum laminariae]